MHLKKLKKETQGMGKQFTLDFKFLRNLYRTSFNRISVRIKLLYVAKWNFYWIILNKVLLSVLYATLIFSLLYRLWRILYRKQVINGRDILNNTFYHICRISCLLMLPTSTKLPFSIPLINSRTRQYSRTKEDGGPQNQRLGTLQD